MNYEEVSRLGYEELKVVALEILKDVTPGWSQVGGQEYANSNNNNNNHNNNKNDNNSLKNC